MYVKERRFCHRWFSLHNPRYLDHPASIYDLITPLPEVVRSRNLVDEALSFPFLLPVCPPFSRLAPNGSTVAYNVPRPSFDPPSADPLAE